MYGEGGGALYSPFRPYKQILPTSPYLQHSVLGLPGSPTSEVCRIVAFYADVRGFEQSLYLCGEVHVGIAFRV